MIVFLQLFFEFFKTGLFAVGGGMATLPFLYDMGAKYPEWFRVAGAPSDVIANMIAVSESTPGPIGVNMATYIGFITGGSIGGTPLALLGAVDCRWWSATCFSPTPWPRASLWPYSTGRAGPWPPYCGS